jgi:hypothetical protein
MAPSPFWNNLQFFSAAVQLTTSAIGHPSTVWNLEHLSNLSNLSNL